GKKSTRSVGSGQSIEPMGNGSRYVDGKIKTNAMRMRRTTQALAKRECMEAATTTTTPQAGSDDRYVENRRPLRIGEGNDRTWNVLKSGPFCTQSASRSPAGRDCAVAG
ncbi:unnamed protein product, partial [Ectocarpus sp. 13 AM-2016]